MATKKPAPATPQIQFVTIQQAALHHRLDALLHTIRSITHYEDALCELSHELKGTAAPSEATCDELREIIERIPAHDYLVDIEMVRDMLADPQSQRQSKPPKRSKTKSLKKPARSPRVRKATAAAKKKLGRRLSKSK